jgi:hypothetical protein
MPVKLKQLTWICCLMLAFFQGGAQNVGIGTNSPSEKLDVA